MTESNIIVLRKIPYSESSLVIATISLTHGRLDFIVKGALRLEKKKMPQVDLFRELSVNFREETKGLHPLYHCDIVSIFDGIASISGNYTAATEIANFALANSKPMLPSPKLYATVKNSFAILSKTKPKYPLITIVKLAYLDEHGLIPFGKDSEKHEKTREVLDKIFSGIETNSMPAFTEQYWRALSDWTRQICEYHGLKN